MSLSFYKTSIVHWFPDSDAEKYKCGYCKQEKGSASNGMWAETLTVDEYQELIDRGWRRSGKYCYKPIMKETCCPQYTIRCDALQFKPSKSQKKVIKKVNKFLNTGCTIKSYENQTDKVGNEEFGEDIVFKERPKSSFNYEKLKSGIASCDDPKVTPEIACSSKTEEMPISAFKDSISCTSMEVENQTDNSTASTKEVKQGVGADPNKPPCKKAKVIRLEKKLKKQGIGATSTSTNVNNEKSLEDLLGEISAEPKHKLRTNLVSTLVPESELKETIQLEFQLYYKYQTLVHNDTPEKVTHQSFFRFLLSSPLKIKLVVMNSESNDFVENCKITSLLYKKYQIFCHNENEDECNEKAFNEFLVDTPLQLKKTDPDFVGFGSFHQQYWLDDKLIAVGVIDILPKCISSVYFFYDPDYRNLTLGTYGSLRELEFTRALHKIVPSIEYYYMGFYIHSCPKMRYKGKLMGSKLLCPETYTWFPIEECIIKLNEEKYSRLNDDLSAVDKDACTMRDINSIKILQNYRYFTFENYKYRNKCMHDFKTIGKLVGKKCIKNLLVVSDLD